MRLFRLRGFSAGSLSVTAQFFAAFGFFFVVLQYLQFVVGRSPLEAALTLLPLPFLLLPSARLAPRLAERFGTNRVDAAGLLSIAAGLALVSQLGVELNQVDLLRRAGPVRHRHGPGRHARRPPRSPPRCPRPSRASRPR